MIVRLPVVEQGTIPETVGLVLASTEITAGVARYRCFGDQAEVILKDLFVADELRFGKIAVRDWPENTRTQKEA